MAKNKVEENINYETPEFEIASSPTLHPNKWLRGKDYDTILATQ